MAREARNLLSYISVDWNFFDKPKMFRIEERFGEVGTARALRLLLWLIHTDGCYLEWGDGSAYYFAKKILGNADAAGEVEELVRLLIDVGFFTPLEETDERGERHVYLTSYEIVRDWMKIKKAAKQKVNFDIIPQIVYTTYIEQIAKLDKKHKSFLKVSEENEINSEGNGDTFRKNSEGITQIKEKKIVQTNKQTNKTSEGIIPEETPDPPGEMPDPGPPDGAVREKVCRIVWFRGISSDLVDAASACVANGWISLDGIRNMRRKARDSLDLFEASKGRRGKEHGWEVIRDCVSLVYREHGVEPPVYRKDNPEPPPAANAPPRERLAAV